MILNLLAALSISVVGCSDGYRLLSYGDSKSMLATGVGLNEEVWQYHLFRATGFRCRLWDIGTPTYAMGSLARGSATTTDMQAAIDADLAVMFKAPSAILVNIGSADYVFGLPVEATFKSNYAYIIDAFHTKFPLAIVYCATPWYDAKDAEANTVHGWIGDVLATRSWAARGPDERSVIKAGDEGVTNTSDGLHYSKAGSIAWAAAWMQVLGL